MKKGLTVGSAFKFTFTSSGTAIFILYIITTLPMVIFGGDSSTEFFGYAANTLPGFLFGLVAMPFLIGFISGFLAIQAVIGQWLYTRFFSLDLALNEPEDV
ncbi:hypothetical protein J3L16_15455 [Alteromonas sp. 5E99-2]|uniref:hypothetical protein n=1 Tax=Alteromonas sp. 5E99-2 TaxID=2817683 RepID=UPI001A99F747|nr:hypothetical protein [Alteromonas sp. 5E99-2]MBO1257080.1 hypothetical protein [Alteromonas sp. 5E99-2]